MCRKTISVLAFAFDKPNVSFSHSKRRIDPKAVPEQNCYVTVVMRLDYFRMKRAIKILKKIRSFRYNLEIPEDKN